MGNPQPLIRTIPDASLNFRFANRIIHSMKTLRTLLLTLTLLAAFTAARATTVIPPTFEQLVERAELIFHGTVTEVKSLWTGEGAQRHIVTYVSFKPEETIKGEAAPSYTLRMLGGTVGDETMEVTDTPKFRVGDRDILFVENNGTQFVPLVGIMHGRFRVRKDELTGKDSVTDHHGHAVADVAALGRPEHIAQATHGAIHSEAGTMDGALDCASFKAAIKARLGQAVR